MSAQTKVGPYPISEPTQEKIVTAVPNPAPVESKPDVVEVLWWKHVIVKGLN